MADLGKTRKTFLQKNPMFTEVELTAESKPIGKLDEFDFVENEIWLLQCPKNMNITELQNQKIKVPGRSNLNSSEAISMEFNKGKERHAFAYCNRKGRYALRLLPVRGTIVVRDRLKAAETVTEERAEECSPPAKRVPMPKGLRNRHPLHGVNYEEKIKLNRSIEKRLQKADANAAQMLKEALKQKSGQNLRLGCEKAQKEIKLEPSIDILNVDDDDSVEFVSVEKLKKKKKKNKRKHVESDKSEHNSDEAHQIKKSNLNEKEFVSEDLQWLQTI